MHMCIIAAIREACTLDLRRSTRDKVCQSRCVMARHKPLGILKKDVLLAKPPRTKPKKERKFKPVDAGPAAASVHKPTQQPVSGRSARSAAAAAALLNSGNGGGDAAGQQQQQEQKEWVPHSPVVRFAAEALKKLLVADESQRSGKSIKSLTLAPHVSTKKATFALTCQTLRCEAATSNKCVDMNLLGGPLL